MDEIVIGEKKYISSKQAAKATGYAKDYVGQLCREGRVPARLVGRSWYVLESAIQDHRFGDPQNEPEEPEKVVIEEKPTLQSTWESPRYEASKAEELPSVNLLQRSTRSEEGVGATGAEESPEYAQRLQDTWQAWFDRFEHIAGASAPAEEAEKSEPEEPETEAAVEEDVVIPVRAIYEEQQLPPEELLPKIETPSQAQREPSRVEVGGRKWGNGRVLLAVQMTGVLLAFFATSLAILGSGYLDSYILSNSQVRIIAGVALYNK